jgi:hypothetical protein
MKSNIKVPFKFFNGLCAPAQLYLVLSLLSLLTLFYQNYSNPNKYCVGIFETKTDCNNRVFFAFKILYIAIWLFILQKLCSKGYSTISWILVLLPIVAMFILIGLILIVLMKKNKQL